MVSQRIKYAMAHLSRKQHTRLLARPNWRRLRRTDMNIVVDPNAISRAALKSKASKRIKIMARPKYVTKKYDVQDYPPPYQRVHPKTLAAKCTSRIRVLAVPKMRVVELRIPKPRKPPPRDHDWKRHREIIEKLAKPKVIHKPRHVPKKRWRPVRMRRIKKLALPVSREIPFARDPFSVAQSALRYRITERMKELAYRKTELEFITPRKLGVISRGALKAIASPRTLILAKPAVRPAGMETDLREDAFTVSPAALKARCSRRLKKLARPKNYKHKGY
ncbi:testicular haploid expressed gene protein-like [Vespa mandarinia]|uniref:testicular haploid expressed gene protein-like n=1 Tax=Vespa mandarinia TaxID=7446 RepID=UPI0016187D24|nr:testicular haploid expressed gene protein-like [Vespa mandarinia]